jgi:hypothetical protein
MAGRPGGDPVPVEAFDSRTAYRAAEGADPDSTVQELVGQLG